MPRKGENIYKRKDGRWEARYVKGRKEDGSIHYGYVYATTYKKVRQKQMTAQMNSNRSSQDIKGSSDTNTLLYWSEQWLKNKKTRIKVSSYNKYSNTLIKYINPFLGAYNIEEIDTLVIEKWICQMNAYNGLQGQGLSDKTISDAVSIIKNIHKYSQKMDRYLVLQSIDVSVKHKAPELRVLSRAEQETLTGYLIENSTRKNMGILLCLFTGIRIGELCALQMKDIFIEQKYIYIHGTMQRVQNNNKEIPDGPKTSVKVLTPKSANSIRKIPIPNELVKMLKKYVTTDDSYFLTGRADKYLEPRAIQYHFKKVLKNCQLEDINFHALRHTFATRCIELGFDIKTLSELLGHASVNITMNRYVHPSMDLKRSNMNRLADLLSVN